MKYFVVLLLFIPSVLCAGDGAFARGRPPVVIQVRPVPIVNSLVNPQPVDHTSLDVHEDDQGDRLGGGPVDADGEGHSGSTVADHPVPFRTELVVHYHEHYPANRASNNPCVERCKAVTCTIAGLTVVAACGLSIYWLLHGLKIV